MDEKFWYLKNCDLFMRLSREDVSFVEARSKARTFKRGNLIYLPNDRAQSVLLLVSGRVKIYHLTGEGKQALLALIDPGELFGELTVLDEGEREEFAETMETCTVLAIPNDVIQHLMQRHPEVSMSITKLMGLRRKRIERRLKSLLFRSNRERLVHLLLELVEKYGRPHENGVQIGIKLSHQELASIIGSTRETVTVILGELQDEGSLIIQRRQIILTKPDVLASGIGVTAPELPQPSQRPKPAFRQSPSGG